MLLAMEDEGLQPVEIAEKYAKAAMEDAAAVGIRPADLYPKATEHILEMIELTQTLLDRGHAYVTDSGSVYDVSFPGYGKLSGNTLTTCARGTAISRSTLPSAARLTLPCGRPPVSGRLMKWDPPWGPGFPGWHVEVLERRP